jgi:hypothetical protein
VGLVAWTSRAGAADPLAPAAAGEARAPADAAAAPAATLPASDAPAWHRGYVGTIGVGYYERVHVGAALELSPRSSIGLFGGTDFGLGDDSNWAVGLSYAHALRQVAGRFELGLDGKAVYWAQSNPDYDWQMMSLIFGAYLSRELRPGLKLGIDGGVALNFSLGTERKQNVNYEYPTRWNGSVCLELRYRFYQW